MKWFRKTETLETRLFKSIVAANKDEVRTILAERPDPNLTFYILERQNKFGLAKPSEIEKFRKGASSVYRYEGYCQIYQRTPAELTDKLLHTWIHTYQPGVTESRRKYTIGVYKDMLHDLVAFGYPAPAGYLCAALAKAVESNDITAVETLLRKKADVNYEDTRVGLPILTAVKNGNLPMVKLLVANGAMKETRTSRHIHKRDWNFGMCRSLMLAVELGHSEIAKYLIESGADVNAKDYRQETVLMKAERKRLPEIVSLLKMKGAELVPPSPPVDSIEEALERGDRMQNPPISEALSNDQMFEALSELCDAYVCNDEPSIARLEPIATRIGEELNRRGGIEEMRRMWNRLGGRKGARTLDMHWDGIGEWRG